MKVVHEGGPGRSPCTGGQCYVYPLITVNL